jgi:hypothetical protein
VGVGGGGGGFCVNEGIGTGFWIGLDIAFIG